MMMTSFDPYKILMVDKDAAFEVIKAAYRVLIKQPENHPDLGGNKENAQLINQAFLVLKEAHQNGPNVQPNKLKNRQVYNRTNTIQCTYCGIKNKLREFRLLKRAWCGSCGQQLTSSYQKNTSNLDNTRSQLPDPKFADFLYNKGLHTRALKDYLILMNKTKENNFILKVGLCYYRLKNYKSAKKYFSMLREDKELNFQTHFWLGKTYLKLKNFDDAIESFHLANKINPKIVKCDAILGICYLKIGDTQNAIDKLKNVVSVEPEVYHSIFWLAHAYAQNQQYSKAIYFATKACKLFPNQPKMNSLLDRCLSLANS